jgi:thiol-disulfide isomerase/thioredoxin
VLFFFIFLFSGERVYSEPTSSSSIPPTNVSAPPEGKIPLPIFEFPVPKTEKDKTYLGISGSKNCKVTQIKSPVIIIEVFTMYCPHCQRSAPFVNDLFQKIQERSDLKQKIKIIGIGALNSAYEVDLFKNKYGILFPLVPDPDGSITKLLGVSGTPTFIGARINNDGTAEQFYFKSGEFSDGTNFLSEILNLAHLEQEGNQ